MANKKSGLGKGLGQLFLENSVDELVANNTLPLEEIVPNKEQPRKTFDETALEELAESIRQYGVLQPLLVRPLPGGGYRHGSQHRPGGRRPCHCLQPFFHHRPQLPRSSDR